MPQLEQTEFFLSQLFWLVVLFVLLFLVLTYFTLPKIRDFLAKRDVFINDHLSRQDDLLKKAELLIQEYEVKIVQAKEEASLIINEAKSRALEESSKLLKITEDNIKQQIKETEERINKEKQIALDNLDKEISSNASLFISKITNQSAEEIKLS
ncbi:ATP synthase F0 subunit B [Alphaproteobacteria bacterium]|nr:ATP synthase F0 subunit B [Alphaproteobacteria bacterium]